MRASSRTDAFSLSDAEPLIREVLDSGGEFELAPTGVSMLPLIRSGRDTVTLVKPSARLAVHDIALYKREDGSFVLHRVISLEKDGYTMCGDNQATSEKGVKESQIIARVSKLTLNGKLYDANCKKLLRYAKLRSSLKLRRIFLALKRRLNINSK